MYLIIYSILVGKSRIDRVLKVVKSPSLGGSKLVVMLRHLSELEASILDHGGHVSEKQPRCAHATN